MSGEIETELVGKEALNYALGMPFIIHRLIRPFSWLLQIDVRRVELMS